MSRRRRMASYWNKPHRKTSKLKLTIYAFTLVLVLLLYARMTFDEKPALYGLAVDTEGCRIPDFDPFDATVLEHYDPRMPYTCVAQPSFIRQDGNTFYVLSDVLKAYFNVSVSDIRCSYRVIKNNYSAAAPDYVLIYSKSYELVFGAPLSAEHIQVECRYRGAVIHREFFIVPLIKSKVELRCRQAARRRNVSRDALNVIVLGLDGVSRLNSLRHLKQTRAYLSRAFHVVELFGYNKVGDNSFPNQLAMLTGRSEEEEAKVCKEGYFDDEELIWKTYGRMGYRTMFLEETPQWGLFTYFCRGFRRRPTDYYPRPFTQTVDFAGKRRSRDNEPYCVRTKAETEVHLEYTTSLLALLGNRSYFTYTWISEVSHDYLNSAGYADAPFLKTFQTLASTGAMDRSVVIFMSDHGQRYGSIRNTLIGKYEDRLPFCILLFPPSFRAKFPEAVRNLEINQRRLTTPYDIHATLMELANFERSRNAGGYRTTRGVSLLHEVPPNRTCTGAFIPPHYCSCQDTQVISTADSLSWRMAEFAVERVNQRLSKELPKKCATLRLHRVVDIRKLLTSVRERTEHYWVTFVTTIANVAIEGTVGVSGEGNFTLNDVSRITFARNQSYCSVSKFTSLFCVCI
ncbi:uncharacterized protein LOC135370230 [Ornithodoros turicata]|uniref:uncharacterized protein LOC135370230 n=1 Tax=Ornithodoros turicata TaxID=34597 RepID=UPI00313A0688